MGGLPVKYEKSLAWLIRSTVVLLIFLCGYIFLKLQEIWLPILRLFAFIAVPLLLSAFITYLLHPIVDALHKRNMPRWLATTVIYVIFFAGAGIAAVKGLPYIITQLHHLAESIPDLFQTYGAYANQLTSQIYADVPEMFHDRVEALLTDLEAYFDTLIEKAINAVKEVINSFFIMIVVPFLVFYFLKDFDKIKTAVWYFTPKRWRKHGQQLIQEIDQSLGQYIRGQLFVITLLCIMASLSFWAIDLPYPILLGMITGIADIVPYFGPFLGAIPVLFIAMTISFNMVIWVLAIIFILHFLEGNVLSPLIVGKSLQMHPALIILVLLVGGELAGVIGMVLAVPFFAVMRVVVVYIHQYKAKH